MQLSDLLLIEPRPRPNDDIYVFTDGCVRGVAVDAYLAANPNVVANFGADISNHIV